MATVNHVESSKNPYHYSFSICASENYVNRINDHGGQQSTHKTYYSYKPNYDSKPAFNCDLCDREFRTEFQYKRHISEHITCGRDGCQFTAHPKVVGVHVRTQHETGVFHLIKKLNAPEEVQKWIQDRKRKYPTQKNIEEQKLVEEEKIKRGERLKSDNRIFNKKFGNRRPDGQAKSSGKPKCSKKNRPRFSKRLVTPKSEKIDDDNDESMPKNNGINGSVFAFKGLNTNDQTVSQVEVKETIQKAIDEKLTLVKPPTPKKAPPLLVNKSLALLMSAYDSGAETDEDQPLAAPPKEQTLDNSDSDSAPEEVKNISNMVSQAAIETVEDRPSRKRKSAKRTNRRYTKARKIDKREIVPRTRKQTLLQKLLNDQLVEERELILPYIRCIVRNNFFGVGGQKKSESKAVLPKKSALLEGLLKDENFFERFISERNMILQCIRQIVNNNFFQSKD